MKLRLLPAALGLLSLAAAAPTVQAAPPVPTPSLNAPKDDLNLTPAQKSKLQALVADFQKQLAALRDDKKMTPAQKQAKFQQMFKALDQKKLAVLTPSQRAKVNQRRKVQMAQMQVQQGKYKARMSQMMAMKKQLDKTLTPDQKKKLKEISSSAQAQERQIAQDPKLSNDVKRQKIGEISAQMRPKVNAILTPSQQAVIAKMEALARQPL